MSDWTHQVLWTSGEDALRILLTAVLGYVALVGLIRLFGKRSTSRMNNFDWLVTVAIGSIFASMVILESVSLVQGLLAIFVLAALQYGLTFATSRWKWAREAFLSPARLLFVDGRFCRDAMRDERVSELELVAAVRQSGAGSLGDTHAVVLESDANLSVVEAGEDGNLETVEPVQGYPQALEDGS